MSNQNRIWVLMSRKLAGEATEKELDELQELLQQHPEFLADYELLGTIWQQPEHATKEELEQAFASHQHRMGEMEAFNTRVRQYKTERASWKRLSAKKGLFFSFEHSLTQIVNYIKIARRSISRNLTFSVINIVGLAIGMASAVLILLLVENQISTDQFHKNRDRVYQLFSSRDVNGEIQVWNATPMELAPVLKLNYPEVEQVTRTNWVAAFVLKNGDKQIQTQGLLVDSSFLDVFDFPLVKGNKKAGLNSPRSILITESLSKKLFGKEESMGKVIRIDSTELFTVTGVLKDLPPNTRFRFEYLVPHSYMSDIGWYNASWGSESVTDTYVLLKPGVTEAAANKSFQHIITQHNNNVKTGLFVHPMRKWALYNQFENGKAVDGAIRFVRLFSIIAIFILLIACINYMNLSTARSVKRGREVGIRKVAGAAKGSLIGQFLWESILFSFIAGAIALVLVEVNLGWFDRLVFTALYVPYSSPTFWLIAVGFVLFTGIIAGSYPAFYLSAYKPISVLKGTFKAAHALIAPRKILVVLQFTFAITFIICTIVIYRQLVFGMQRDIGYNKNNLAYTYNKGEVDRNYALIKRDLLNSGAVTAVARSSSPITDVWSWEDKLEWKGKDPKKQNWFMKFQTDKDFAKTMQLKMLKGRDIDTETFPHDSMAIVINETAAKIMGFDNPIGEFVKTPDGTMQVVGMVNDFFPESPYINPQPAYIQGPTKQHWFGSMLYRLNEQHSTAANMAKITAIYKKYNPDYPFDNYYADEAFSEKFTGEKIMGTLAALFAGLTIVISCLGLFALSAYMAESRIKEIGIRKVLGASITGITTLLSKDFLKLVIIAFILASPLAWWAMSNWLQQYSYRKPLSWWIFAATGGISIFIALLTVSYQSIKAALANPVKSLRSE